MSSENLSFDFESLYEKYPRKRGKFAGMRALNCRIKTAKQYQDFARALDNYLDILRKEHTQLKFVMHFGTFVNNWSDYLDNSLAAEPQSKNISQLERIMKGEL